MKDLKKNCRAAVIQCAPVLFDKEASVRRCAELIGEAAKEKPDLIVLPELIVPGYPYGMTFGFTVGSRKEPGRRDWLRYAKNSVLVPGPETKLLGEAARAARAWVSAGISERDPVTGTLYNSNVIFAPDGRLAALHRKLKPTGAERLVWGDADRNFFPVVDTPWGPIGCLICWEAYMPLARAALYQKGVTILISCNTNDNPEWQATVRHIALEGRCYVINCDQFFRRSDYPADLEEREAVEALPETVCRGGSCVADPFGHCLCEPVWDREAILYADLDLDRVAASRMEFDPCGHYARPDVLRLEVNDK